MKHVWLCNVILDTSIVAAACSHLTRATFTNVRGRATRHRDVSPYQLTLFSDLIQPLGPFSVMIDEQYPRSYDLASPANCSREGEK